MNKIISYIAIVVLSIAGFSAFAKEVTSEPQKTLLKVEAKAAELAAGIEKVQKQLSELDAQKNERMKVEIERDRKGIEFWFAALAIMTTIVAALGALFPYLMARKDKELLKVELAGVKNDRAEIQRMKDEVEKDKMALQVELQNAKDMVASIRHQHMSAEKSATSMSNLLAEFSSANKPSEAEKVEVAKQAESITKDPNASTVDKLRARAIEASQHEKPTREQAEIAFDLWKAIAVENPQDDNALFNAAYWAATVGEKSMQEYKRHWFQQAQRLNRRTLEICPEDHSAASNCGIALAKEAEILVKTDAKTAQTLWQQAVELLEKYGENAPGKISYNLACFYSQLERFDESLSRLEAARLRDALPSHWLDDDDLANLRETDEYKTWYKTHFGDDKS